MEYEFNYGYALKQGKTKWVAEFKSIYPKLNLSAIFDKLMKKNKKK